MPFSFPAIVLILCTWASVAYCQNTPRSAQPSSPAGRQDSSAGNAYCTPEGAWIGASTDGPAKMPLECMYTALSGTPSPGKIRGPHSTTTDVQADINAAACGDKILVTAG